MFTECFKNMLQTAPITCPLKMARKKTSNKKGAEESKIYTSYVDKLESQVQSNQSRLSMLLGGLIILVVGILVFNYFNRNQGTIDGPAQTSEVQEGDVSVENLPGKYTVKNGDTLFKISEKYYGDGFKYTEIATVNNLSNSDNIEEGQVLEIPKLEQASKEGTESAMEQQVTDITPVDTGSSKGAPDITMAQKGNWGPAITENTYTVVKEDWLSKIAGRAYGDILAYDKIAKANNISNPDLIEPGTVLTIPR